MTKEIAKISNQELLALSTEFAGAINVRQELIKVSRLRLTQKMSDAMSADLGKEGDFVCNETGKNYGKSVTIIPILITESASLLYSKSKEPSILNKADSYKEGQVLCTSNNLITNKFGNYCRDCQFGEFYSDWGTPDNKKVPKCHLSIDVICIADGEKEPMVLSFRKTSYPAGKSLINFIVKDPKGIPFANKYKLTSQSENKDNYKFVVIQESVTKTALTDDELVNVIPIARRILNAKKQGEIIHETEENEDIPV